MFIKGTQNILLWVFSPIEHGKRGRESVHSKLVKYWHTNIDDITCLSTWYSHFGLHIVLGGVHLFLSIKHFVDPEQTTLLPSSTHCRNVSTPYFNIYINIMYSLLPCHHTPLHKTVILAWQLVMLWKFGRKNDEHFLIRQLRHFDRNAWISLHVKSISSKDREFDFWLYFQKWTANTNVNL